MPNRILREGINSSARINALSPMAEIFYRRLMSVVDDYGRYYASPGTLRGACWPTCPDRFTDAEVHGYLTECAHSDVRGRRLVMLYESDGCLYLQLDDFKQQCRSKSKFPDPDINCLADCLADAEQLLSTSRSRISESKTETYTESGAGLRVPSKVSQMRKPPEPSSQVSQRAQEWLEGFKGRKTKPEDFRSAWVSCVTVADEERAFAARDLYNASGEVARGILMEAAKFIWDQHHNKWGGAWEPPSRASPKSKQQESADAWDRA